MAEEWYSCSLGSGEEYLANESAEISQEVADIEQNYLDEWCSPLDSSRIHPEHYEAAFTIVKSALGYVLDNAATDYQSVFGKFEELRDSFSLAKAER